MFKKGKAKNIKEQQANKAINSSRQEVGTVVGLTTTIEGNIHFTGVLKVDGHVIGNLVADEPGAVLILNSEGIIEGEVRVSNMIVNGKIEGNLYINEKIELFQSARITGDVHYNLLEMEVGSEVNGRLIKEDVSAVTPLSSVEPDIGNNEISATG